MKSDYKIVIGYILDRTKTASQIIDLIADIVALARNFRNIQFTYCNKNVNRLTNAIAKKAHCITNSLYYCYNEYFSVGSKEKRKKPNLGWFTKVN